MKWTNNKVIGDIAVYFLVSFYMIWSTYEWVSADREIQEIRETLKYENWKTEKFLNDKVALRIICAKVN